MAQKINIAKLRSGSGFLNKIKIGSLSDYFFAYLYAAIFIGFGMTVLTVTNGYIIILILIIIWMILNLVFLDAVVKVEIKNPAMLAQDFEHALSLHFIWSYVPDSMFKRKCNTKSSRFIYMEDGVTIIRDSNYLYFNVIYLLIPHDIPSPFHGLYNYYKCRKVARYFSLLQS